MARISENQFEELRHLILESDREDNARQTSEILAKIDELEKELNDPEKFAGVIQQSKDEVIDVLGPVMGKMIKKFISSEMDKLRQNIESRSRAIFSLKFLKRKIKSRVTGVSESDLVINESIKSSLLQIFVIEKNTGLFIGKYAPEDLLDSDLVAGMLSAIKSFIESAFGQENSELESLEYSNYKILLYNFNRFYFACVMEGNVDANTRSNLQDDFLNLVDEKLGTMSLKQIDDTLRKNVENALHEAFKDKYNTKNM